MTTSSVTASSKTLTEREVDDLDADALREIGKLQADVDDAAKVVVEAEKAVVVARRAYLAAVGTRSRRSLERGRARQVLAK